ncbi:TPA: hypothetical protein ACN33C_004484 [Vibrio parahaemolyticus]
MANNRTVLYLDRNDVARHEFSNRHENSKVDVISLATVHDVENWIKEKGHPDLVIVDLYRERIAGNRETVDALESKLAQFGQDRRSLLKELESAYEEVGFDDFDDLRTKFPDGDFPIAVGSRYGRRLCSSKKSSIFQSKGGCWIWKQGDRPGESGAIDKLYVEQEEDSMLRLINSFEMNYGKYSSLYKKYENATKMSEEKDRSINDFQQEIQSVLAENEKLVLEKKAWMSLSLTLSITTVLFASLMYATFLEGSSIEKLSIVASIATFASLFIGLVSMKTDWLTKLSRKLKFNKQFKSDS